MEVWDGDRKRETWTDTVEVFLREFFPADVRVNYELYCAGCRGESEL